MSDKFIQVKPKRPNKKIVEASSDRLNDQIVRLSFRIASKYPTATPEEKQNINMAVTLLTQALMSESDTNAKRLMEMARRIDSTT